jgi:hypothetical protein
MKLINQKHVYLLIDINYSDLQSRRDLVRQCIKTRHLISGRACSAATPAAIIRVLNPVSVSL